MFLILCTWPLYYNIHNKIMNFELHMHKKRYQKGNSTIYLSLLEQPTEPKKCKKLEYTGTEPNIVHWKCFDNGIILNPYETEMESGTECFPMHM